MTTLDSIQAIMNSSPSEREVFRDKALVASTVLAPFLEEKPASREEAKELFSLLLTAESHLATYRHSLSTMLTTLKAPRKKVTPLPTPSPVTLDSLANLDLSNL